MQWLTQQLNANSFGSVCLDTRLETKVPQSACKRYMSVCTHASLILHAVPPINAAIPTDGKTSGWFGVYCKPLHKVKKHDPPPSLAPPLLHEAWPPAQDGGGAVDMPQVRGVFALGLRL